ncbi:glucose-1-phosphate thymidylyltransferase [Candidatus Omnitrophus magneticus]|uniref:Glucose-1-phosphate thymidylyltransferase n=1 Tax=Candidatus Omnitrophus magneticus TaxID=1609969 RepID=A0A0F0CWW5_9BACT|nr:glucose-1-phosphate thymidylyltransferase [Candidatus Omnitrophus magneticus]
MLSPNDFFDFSQTRFKDIFDNVEFVWDSLKKIKEYARKNISPNVPSELCGRPLDKTIVLFNGDIITEGFTVESGDVTKGQLIIKKDGEKLAGASIIYAGAIIMDDLVEIGKSTVVEPTALIKGPAIIGDNTEVRHGAYIRGDVLVGNSSIVGHTTEIKSSIMLGASKAGHFAYIGDSILGKVNLGAGTKLANLKVINKDVAVKIEDRKYETGLKKFGAIIGDNVEIGCNTVTTPGTLLARGVLVYPNTTLSGYYEKDLIVKLRQTFEKEKRR